MDAVFALTTIANERCQTGALPAARTVGVFASAEAAERVLTLNLGDLNEAGLYKYAVVERICFGLYPMNNRDGRWFAHTNNAWQPLSGPPPLTEWHLLGWASIG